jgi:hypothetical protein
MTTTKKKGAALHGSFFDQFLGFFQALDPSIKRDAQTKRFLARSALAALKLFRNFTGTGSLPSKRLQGSHICRRPRTTFSIFHDDLSQL